MPLSGEIGEISMADVFKAAAREHRSGILTVKSGRESFSAHFNFGNLVRADSAGGGGGLLGGMLADAGVLDEKRLGPALAQSARTMAPLEKVLIDEQIITAEEARVFLKLRNTEAVFRMFLLEEGAFEFEPGDVPIDRTIEEPVETDQIAAETELQRESWPGILEAVPYGNMTFLLLDGPVPAPKLAPAERRALSLLREDGSRDVNAVIALSRLGRFEACSALASLVGYGYLSAEEPKRGVPPGVRPRGRIAVDPAGTLAFLLTLGALLAMLALAAARIADIAGPGADGAAEALQVWTLKEPLAAAQKRKLSLAIDTWKLWKGNYPGSLADLVEAGFLEKRDISHPWRLEYTYYIDGGKYVLLDPVR
jgi:hypothetical protein